MGSRQPAPPAKATRAANDTCGFSGVLPQIGQPLTPQMQAEMLRAKGPAKLRLIRPGMVIAQDFQPDRLNLILDKDGDIVTARCG